jgi:hypothetical protein
MFLQSDLKNSRGTDNLCKSTFNETNPEPVVVMLTVQRNYKAHEEALEGAVSRSAAAWLRR